MTLCDKTIKILIEKGDLVINPYNPKNIQSASIDLTLGNGFKVPNYDRLKYHGIKPLSLDDEVDYKNHDDQNKIIIPPKNFILGKTFEYLEIPEYTSGRIDGKSSIGRKGIFIQNAGHVNPGNKGNLTLEIYNGNEISFEIESGKLICQLILEYTDQTVENPYKGRFQGQRETTGS